MLQGLCCMSKTKKEAKILNMNGKANDVCSSNNVNTTNGVSSSNNGHAPGTNGQDHSKNDTKMNGNNEYYYGIKKLEVEPIEECVYKNDEDQMSQIRRKVAIKELRCASIMNIEDDALFEATSKETRVLVIYTGGTIGMMRDATGALRPIAGALSKRVKRLPQMHDAEYAQRRISKNSCNHDSDFHVLPLVGMGHRIIYKILEWENLIDSSDMSIDGWILIAQDIEKHYSSYDGFVILHGTDTMAYTASALSFMLENLGKTVVLTGSQIPIFEPRSDGADNLVSALIIAGTVDIPEVTLYFGNNLYRGNRTSKNSADNFDAFHSPNFDPLVTTGITLEINSREIFRPSAIATFRAHTNLVRDVATVRMFPGMSTAAIKAFLQPPMKGVILETYGAGNIPTNRKDIHDELKKAAERGVIIVNITQCSRGSVKALYKSGQFVSEYGILSGFDMTPEAALTKLAYVLSKDDWDMKTKRQMMETNIRGELSNGTNKVKDFSIIDAVGRCVGVHNAKEASRVAEESVLPALLAYAAVESRPDLVDTLQEFGADVCTPNYDGRTALHVAATLGEVRVMEKLLRYGTNVHMKDRYGNTPLMDAIHGEQEAAVDTLLKCGAQIGVADIGRVAQEICAAASRGLTYRLSLYKKAGAHLNAADQSGRTPLHMASLTCHEETIKYLLKEGLDSKAKDNFGLTPLDYAEKSGCASVFNSTTF